MKAGNRKPPKKQKKARSQSNGRVTFVQWYHSWLCITLCMIFMPIAGIILLVTSPHKTKYKILFALIFCFCYFVLPFIVFFIYSIIMTEVIFNAAASAILLLL